MPTPTAQLTAQAASPARVARPAPCTAAAPQILRVTNTSGMATTVWPIVVARASMATTWLAGTSSTSTMLATIVITQLPASATAATLSRPMTNMTRDRLAITAAPAMPGANSRNASTSWETWSDCLASTCAAGMAMAAITAVPSHDMSRMARVDPALARSKSAPSRADSTGNALTTMDRARMAEIELNTCEP
jgi:hypothetical protein